MNFYNVRTTTLLFVSLLSGLCSAGCRAQPPAPPPPPPGAAGFVAPPSPPPPRGGPEPPPPPLAAQGSRGSLSGVVRSLTYGPGGPDGLILDQGAIIHFPPEFGSQVSSVAPVGSAVVASGWSHTGPAMDTLFDADKITNQRSRASITITAGPPPGPPPASGAVAYAGPPPPPRGFAVQPAAPPAPSQSSYQMQSTAAVSPTVITGVVRSLNYAVDGQINGFVLSDGTPVYFPPEFAEQVMRIVTAGVRVRITGSLRAGAAGNRLMDAQSITNRQTGGSVAVPNAGAPMQP
jgi:hypothetical protein